MPPKKFSTFLDMLRGSAYPGPRSYSTMDVAGLRRKQVKSSGSVQLRRWCTGRYRHPTLQLNTAETEVIWCSSSRRQEQIPQAALRVGNDSVIPASSMRDLAIYIDSDAPSVKTHVSRTVSCCFAALRQIRSIRRSVSQLVLQSLVVSLLLTRLDYGNATLSGVASNQLDRLQSVTNAAARLVYSARNSDHITPLLRDLRWLRVPQRIEFKLSVLVFRCLHGLARPHLARALCRVADMDCRRRLRSASTLELHVPLTRRVNVGDRAFAVSAAHVWNGLPSDIITLPSLIAFKWWLNRARHWSSADRLISDSLTPVLILHDTVVSFILSVVKCSWSFFDSTAL